MIDIMLQVKRLEAMMEKEKNPHKREQHRAAIRNLTTKLESRIPLD